MAFPARISDLTVAALNEALLASGVLRFSRVVRCDIAPGPGKGGTSTVHLLHLEYDTPADAAPARMLAKFSSESEAVREALRPYGFYRQEIAFYSRIGARAGIPVPACYASGYNESDNTCLLLLEYIPDTRTIDVYDGQPGEIEAVIRLLAPFHAQWWRSKDIPAAVESDYTEASLVRRSTKAARALGRIRESHAGEIDATFLAVLEIWVAHFQQLTALARSRPMTLCHGSLHRGQILFRESGTGGPILIDWQNVSLNFGANDLARLIVTGLLPAQRREHERRFIELYHSLLLAHGVANYSFEDLLNDYRMGVVNHIVFHSLMLAEYPVAVIARHWDGPESFWETLFHWPGMAADDAGALPWLLTQVSHEGT